jgi:hypothetical protein
MNLIRTFCARFGACKPDAAERVEASEPVRLGRENRSLIHEIRAILEDRDREPREGDTGFFLGDALTRRRE